MRLEDIKRLLHNIYNINQQLENTGETFAISPILVGDPGIGKTSIVRQFANELGKKVVILRLSQLDDPSQLLGFPYKLYKVSQNEENTIWVTEGELKNYNQVHGAPITKYAKPDFVSQLEEGDILLIDDFSRQIPFFNNAVMEIIYEKGNISWKLPKGCMVVLTANPDGEDYQVNSLDEAQKRRLLYIDVDFSIKDWINYCKTKGISDKYLNFIQNNPNFFKTKNNPEGLVPSKLTELGLIIKYNNIEECKPLLKLYLGSKYMLLVKEFSVKNHSYDFQDYFEGKTNIEKVKEDLSTLDSKLLYNSFKELEYYLLGNIKDKEEMYCKKLKTLRDLIPKDSYFAILNELVKNNNEVTEYLADDIIELNNIFI